MLRLTLVICILGVTWGRNINYGSSQSFRTLDANGDGHISRQEIQDHLQWKDEDRNRQLTRNDYDCRVDAENPDPQARRDVRKLFDHLDRDINGVLYRRDIDDIFDEADSDRDERINEDEYDRSISRQQSHQLTSRLGRMIKLLSSQTFSRLDTNGDGHISRSEARDNQNGDERNRHVTREQFERRVDKQQPDSQIRRILKQLFEQMDKDRSGVLDSRDTEANFDEADTDGDDHLSQDEYNRHIARQLNGIVALTVGLKLDNAASQSFRQIDRNGDMSISRSELEEKLNEKDFNQDGHVTREEYVGHIRDEVSDPQTRRILQNIFDDFDKDRNGILDRRDSAVVFDETDTDRDGRLSQAEYKRAVAKQLSRIPRKNWEMHQENSQPQPQPQPQPQSQRKLDANDDRRVSRTEMEDQLFEMDADKDDQVSREEYNRWVDAGNPSPQARRLQINNFDNLDKDNNGILDRKDVDVIFDEADSDRDDYITADEYLRYLISIANQRQQQKK